VYGDASLAIWLVGLIEIKIRLVAYFVVGVPPVQSDLDRFVRLRFFARTMLQELLPFPV